jgi:hypothetical protein
VRRSTNKRIKALRERKAQLENELRTLQDRARREERKKETRRQILAGAWLFDLIERGAFPADAFEEGMDTFLVRDRDRALFDFLAPKESD